MIGILDNYVDILEDNINDHTRWSVVHEIIFKYEDKTWRAFYSVGATESQDECPWQYEDEVECFEVESVQKIIQSWEDKE